MAGVIHVFLSNWKDISVIRKYPVPRAAMAEPKRQHTGGKLPVATPQIGAASLVSIESAMSNAIGAR